MQIEIRSRSRIQKKDQKKVRGPGSKFGLEGNFFLFWSLSLKLTLNYLLAFSCFFMWLVYIGDAYLCSLEQ